MKKKSVLLFYIVIIFFTAYAYSNPGDIKEPVEHDGGASSYTCSSGGPGSSSCTVSANIGIGDGSGGTSCSVTCNSGYYACCNAYYNKCQCRKEK